MCKWHGRRAETLLSEEENDVSSESCKSSLRSDQNFPSDKFISADACEILTPLPGVSAMDHAATRKLRKLYGLRAADHSSSTVAIDSTTASPRSSPSEDCAATPQDSSSGKLHTRFKSKNLLEHLRKKRPFSARSRPMGSSDDKSPFSPSIRNESVLNRPVVRGKLDCSTDRPNPSFSPQNLHSDEEISHITSLTRGGRQFDRPLGPLQEEKERTKPTRIGSAWTAVGMLISIGGLFGGRMVAVVSCVFWWLLLTMVSRHLGVGEPSIANNSATRFTQLEG